MMLELLVVVISFIVIPILFYIMNTKRSKSESDSSDDSSESGDELLMKQNSDEGDFKLKADRSLDTDAVNPEMGRIGRRVVFSVNLSISDVRDIEENLEDYEKVSLIFLLSDDYEDCLNKVKLSKWASRVMFKCPNWEEKIWEALSIIKNFQIPKKYGLSKEKLIGEFFPLNYCTSKHVSKFKKILFFICENFKKDDENRFLQQLQKDFESKHLNFPDFAPGMEMEVYFSFLLKTKYISSNNARNCSIIAKMLDLEIACGLFECINDGNENSTPERETKKSNLTKQISQSSSNISYDEIDNDERDISLANSDSTQDNVPVFSRVIPKQSPSKGIYKSDGNKICYIINQKNFYTEVEKEYEHLLPPNIEKEKLHTRLGTEVDSNRLKSVFEKRNFKVVVENNLSHLKMISKLERMVASIDKNTCSCFFVVILSHGNKGVVYCANSCYVEIVNIINIMDNRKLVKIPKILILQTCQGPSLQIVDESLTTDGDGSSIESGDPKSPDFLLFSATVPGFASIRDKNKGTWFIQALCDEVEETADKEHFLDICTNIIDKVESRKWSKKGNSLYQIAYARTTLSKKLYI